MRQGLEVITIYFFKKSTLELLPLQGTLVIYFAGLKNVGLPIWMPLTMKTIQKCSVGLNAKGLQP